MSPLIHLVYASVATSKFGPSQLSCLLEQSRANNEQAGLTGMLLYCQGSFFQVLEGEPPAVHQVYQRIEADPRHAHPIVIIREPIPRRSFGEWSMGFAAPEPEELISVAGFNDFFREGSCFSSLHPGRAKKLLTAFANGRWRGSLTGPLRAAG